MRAIVTKIIWRTSGSDGPEGAFFFFASECLQEEEGHHRQQRVVV
jgi:hypothetical protein